MYAKVESERLSFIRNNQNNLEQRIIFTYKIFKIIKILETSVV